MICLLLLCHEVLDHGEKDEEDSKMFEKNMTFVVFPLLVGGPVVPMPPRFPVLFF